MGPQEAENRRTIKHVVEAMTPPATPVLSSAVLATPSLKKHRKAKNTEKVVPTSAYSTVRTRKAFKSRCSHLTMTRIFAPDISCDQCGRPGAWDWLYRCTEDRELIILEGIREGRKVWYDTIGQHLSQAATPAARGPEARSSRYSLFEEIIPQAIGSYSPDQIAILMKQREEVKQAIQATKKEQEPEGGLIPVSKLTTLLKGQSRPSWVPREQDECRATICHSCRPFLSERSYLSIDGIANGDIPAEAALGWGFNFYRQRPVCKVEHALNLGRRPVFSVSGVSLHTRSTSIYSASVRSIENSIDHTLEVAYAEFQGDDDVRRSAIPDKDTAVDDQATGHLSKITVPTNLSEIPYDSSAVKAQDNMEHGEKVSEMSTGFDWTVRPPWTPPPTPTPGPDILEAFGCCGDVLDDHGSPVVFYGRSPSSLKVNSTVRNEVFTSMTPKPWHTNPDGTHDPAKDWEHGHPHVSNHIRYEDEETYDKGLTLRFNQTVFDMACALPLPHPGSDERLFFAEDAPTAMEEQEMEDGFNPTPLDVPHGVAVTEEGVECSVADIITQC